MYGESVLLLFRFMKLDPHFIVIEKLNCIYLTAFIFVSFPTILLPFITSNLDVFCLSPTHSSIPKMPAELFIILRKSMFLYPRKLNHWKIFE